MMNVLIPNAAISAKYLEERVGLEKECTSRLTNIHLQLGVDSDETLQGCIDKKNAAELTALLAGLSTLSTPFMPWAMTKMATSRALASTMKELPNGRIISALDLSNKNELKLLGLEGISNKYWQTVAATYKDRLKLSDEEIASFIKSSVAYEDRTTLILQTQGKPSAGKIDGGVAMVESKSSKDLLPFEKATGVKVSREGKVGEIVRLTAVNEDHHTTMKNVLTSLASMTRTDPELKKIYIFTSKIHMRMYMKMNIPFKRLKDPNERDVLIEINAQDFQNAF